MREWSPSEHMLSVMTPVKVRLPCAGLVCEDAASARQAITKNMRVSFTYFELLAWSYWPGVIK